MSASHLLARLLSHNAWADERVLAALRRAQVDERDVKRALELLAHLIAAEAVWLARIVQRDAPVPIWPTLSLHECEALARATHAGLLDVANSLDESDATRIVRYRNSSGVEFHSTVEDMLLQVALHGSYHRGQIALLLRDAGAEPQPTDYIAFVRGAPAATRADGSPRPRE